MALNKKEDWRAIANAFDTAYPEYPSRLVYSENGVWKVWVRALGKNANRMIFKAICGNGIAFVRVPEVA